MNEPRPLAPQPAQPPSNAGGNVPVENQGRAPEGLPGTAVNVAPSSALATQDTGVAQPQNQKVTTSNAVRTLATKPPATEASQAPSDAADQAPAAKPQEMARDHVIATFATDEEMREFVQLWQQQQGALRAMKVLEGYWSQEQEELAKALGQQQPRGSAAGAADAKTLEEQIQQIQQRKQALRTYWVAEQAHLAQANAQLSGKFQIKLDGAYILNTQRRALIERERPGISQVDSHDGQL